MPSIAEFTPLMWVILVVGGITVGLSKTGLPGLVTIAIALFATVLPAKASTGALLMTLIVGDVFALLAYRRHADWSTLWRLVPAVAAGLVLGAQFLAIANDGWVRRVIGVILLLVIAFTLWRRYRPSAGETSDRNGRLARIGYGTLGGFTTMVANAGGPVISMYLLAARFNVLAFLGTAAWFFAVINITKVPIAIGLGLITLDTIWLILILVPAVMVGALAGCYIAKRIEQEVFDWVVIIGTVLGAVYLLVV